jgi:hypothetical protein
MLSQAGLRPGWPVIGLVRWTFLGLASPFWAVRKSPISAARGRGAYLIRLWGLACIAAAYVATANPATETPRGCEVSSPQAARTLADKLFEKGEYQRAGACYQAAGDMVHANLAFLKAVGPDSEDSARAVKAQADSAKSLFATVEHAFRSSQ